MIDRYFTLTKIRTRLRNGPIGPFFPAFITALEERGYASPSIRRMVRTADQLGRWIQEQGVSLQEANRNRIDQYVASQGRRSDQRNKCGHLPQLARHMTTITEILRQQGILKGPGEVTDVDLWADRFAEHLIQVCGVSRFTKDNYVRYARRLMADLKVAGRLDWRTLDAAGICHFVQREAAKLNPRSCTQPVTAVRSLLRYLECEGCLQPNLGRAIPVVRTWSHVGLPKYLTREQSEGVIAVCGGHLEESVRDRAMVLMMARLGMRAGEVRQIRLDDIDWNEGVIHVRKGKARTERILPLPDDVGQLVVAYLRQERPQSPHRQLFVRKLPPYQGLAWSTDVSKTAKRFLAHAGIEGPRLAAHCLRHSVATQIVRTGSSLQQAADVLGHKSLQSTGIYAKLDDQTLRQVALPWPGGAL